MGHRTLAQQKMSHERKKVENRWPKAMTQTDHVFQVFSQ